MFDMILQLTLQGLFYNPYLQQQKLFRKNNIKSINY